MKSILLTIVIIFLLSADVFAQDFSIKAQVDKNTITLDEAFTYKIIVNSSEKQIPQPQIPEFKGFDIISKLQSSSISWVKGNPKTVLSFTFILVPTEIGKFKIEPSIIKIKNKTYSTDSFEIEVTQGKAKPKTKPKPYPPEETRPDTETESPQITL